MRRLIFVFVLVMQAAVPPPVAAALPALDCYEDGNGTNRWQGHRYSTTPGAGHDLAPLGEAVADHQPPAGRVEQRGVRIEMRAALGLQGQGQHLARRQAAQLVEVERSDLGAGVDVAPDALRPGLHRARQPTSPPQSLNGSPRLGLGHPASPQPRVGSRRSRETPPVPHP